GERPAGRGRTCPVRPSRGRRRRRDRYPRPALGPGGHRVRGEEGSEADREGHRPALPQQHSRRLQAAKEDHLPGPDPAQPEREDPAEVSPGAARGDGGPGRRTLGRGKRAEPVMASGAEHSPVTEPWRLSAGELLAAYAR